jgi:hypothetical protein
MCFVAKQVRGKIMAFRSFRRIVFCLIVIVSAMVLGSFLHKYPSPKCASASTLYQADDGSKPGSVFRAIIEYHEGSFRLEKLIPLKMMLPPSDPDPEKRSAEGASGFWIELQSPEGAVLYRRILQDPILYHQEGVAPGSPKGQLSRVDWIPETRTFSILIPDLPNGDQVVFFGSVIPNLAAPSLASQSDIDRAKEQPAQRIGSVRISR